MREYEQIYNHDGTYISYRMEGSIVWLSKVEKNGSALLMYRFDFEEEASSFCRDLKIALPDEMRKVEISGKKPSFAIFDHLFTSKESEEWDDVDQTPDTKFTLKIERSPFSKIRWKLFKIISSLGWKICPEPQRSSLQSSIEFDKDLWDK